MTTKELYDELVEIQCSTLRLIAKLGNIIANQDKIKVVEEFSQEEKIKGKKEIC